MINFKIELGRSIIRSEAAIADKYWIIDIFNNIDLNLTFKEFTAKLEKLNADKFITLSHSDLGGADRKEKLEASEIKRFHGVAHQIKLGA